MGRGYLTSKSLNRGLSGVSKMTYRGFEYLQGKKKVENKSPTLISCVRRKKKRLKKGN